MSSPSMPASVDAHSMSPAVVLGLLAGLGGHVPHVVVVGCQPLTLEEGIGLRTGDGRRDAGRRGGSSMSSTTSIPTAQKELQP